MSWWGPRARAGLRLQILLSGYRSSLPKMWRGPDWPGRGWPSQLTNDQSDFFPGHPSFNYCGERGWTRRGIRYFSLLVRPTILWAARESSIKPEKWIVRNTSWRLPLFNNELPKMSSDFTNWNANNAEWHRAQYIRPGWWLWWIRPILQSI